MVPPSQHPFPAPCIAGTPDNNKKREQTEFWESIKRVQDMLEKVIKGVNELKVDITARSITISFSLQLLIPSMIHTPPKVWSLCSLAWVPSFPVSASPMFSPGLQNYNSCPPLLKQHSPFFSD
jgi:hypothetical protein